MLLHQTYMAPHFRCNILSIILKYVGIFTMQGSTIQFFTYVKFYGFLI
jgi:hypothetical protein